MPGEPRTNRQKLVTFHADPDLVDLIEASRKRARHSKSQWLRDAVLEKLAAEGIPVSDELALPPDRSGKGGPRKVIKYKDELKKKKA